MIVLKTLLLFVCLIAAAVIVGVAGAALLNVLFGLCPNAEDRISHRKDDEDVSDE